MTSGFLSGVFCWAVFHFDEVLNYQFFFFYVCIHCALSKNICQPTGHKNSIYVFFCKFYNVVLSLQSIFIIFGHYMMHKSKFNFIYMSNQLSSTFCWKSCYFSIDASIGWPCVCRSAPGHTSIPLVSVSISCWHYPFAITIALW